MKDDIANPTFGPPDFVIDYIRSSDPARWFQSFFHSGCFFIYFAPIFVIFAIILWSRGVTFSRYAVLAYCGPSLSALLSFVSEVYSLGNSLGQDGFLWQLRPSFGELFLRLIIGNSLSIALFVIGLLLHIGHHVRSRPDAA